MSGLPSRRVDPSPSDDRCPVCNGIRSPLFWSKAGMTYRICDEHKRVAREMRREARPS